MPAFAEARNYRSSAQDFCIVTSARYNEVLSRDRVLITMIGCSKQRDFLSIYLYFLIIRCSVVMSALKIKVELHSVANKKQPRIDSFFTG